MNSFNLRDRPSIERDILDRSDPSPYNVMPLKSQNLTSYAFKVVAKIFADTINPSIVLSNWQRDFIESCSELVRFSEEGR
jgi:hypothetical protein